MSAAISDRSEAQRSVRMSTSSIQRRMRFVSNPTQDRLDTSVPHINGPVYRSVPFETRDVDILNGRLNPGLSLEENGFVCARLPTAYAKETRPEVLRKDYLDEMAPKIKALLGASRVLPRRGGTYIRTAGSQALVDSYSASGQPATFAHIDFAHSEPPRLALLEASEEGVPSEPFSRLMVIQVWRPLTPPPQDMPLAVCDARTIKTEDVVEQIAKVGADNVEGNVFRTLKVKYSDAQRWHYFPDMDTDEVILFKGFDSQKDAPWRVAHSAFDDRERCEGAAPRRSIEARFFVYFN